MKRRRRQRPPSNDGRRGHADAVDCRVVRLRSAMRGPIALWRRILMRQRAAGHWVRWIVLACFGCVTCIDVAAQTPSGGPLTLNEAIQLALKNYPAIKESRARAQAAEEGVGVARTAYLPRLDMCGRKTGATTNNVFGLLLPQSIAPFDLRACARDTIARRQCLGQRAGPCSCRGTRSTSGNEKRRGRCARANLAREVPGSAHRARCRVRRGRRLSHGPCRG